MSRESENYSLEDIIAEFKDMDSGIKPEKGQPAQARPAPAKEETEKKRAAEAPSRPVPARNEATVQRTPAEPPRPAPAGNNAAVTRVAGEPPRPVPSKNEAAIRKAAREPSSPAPSGRRPARNSRLLVCSAVLYALLLVWGLFNVHPGSVALVMAAEPPQETQPLSAPETEPQATAQPGDTAPGTDSPEETPEATQEPKVHYTIPEGSVIAPRANPANFGSVPVENASELSAVIERAREDGLLGEDETVVFDPEASFNTGSYYKDIQYYYDETILAIAWKQIVDGNTVTCMEVKVADASQFRRKLTGDAYGSPTDYLSNLYKSTNAIAATNADFYQFRDYGVMVYDGVLYKYTDKLYIEHNGVNYRWYNCLDNCFITRDGDFLFTYFGEAFTQEELQQYIADNNIAFSLSFGPILVDNYELQTHYDGWYPVGEVNQGYSRAGIGQVDTLHYLYMSLNHSDEKSARWTMLQFGEFFQSMGVKKAYAFDGGQTSEIIFNGDIYAHVDKGSERWVSDMLYFATALPEEAWNNG